MVFAASVEKVVNGRPQAFTDRPEREGGETYEIRDTTVKEKVQ